MSAELVVTIGEYLGRLPFTDEAGTLETADTHMLSGRLVRLTEPQAETLAFCRAVRTMAELTDWVEAEGYEAETVTELVGQGILRVGEMETFLEWLGDVALVPAGRSVGWVDGELRILISDTDVVSVSPAAYWVWLFSRAGNTLRATLDYVRAEAGVAVPEGGELGAVLTQLLVHKLVRCELP